MSANSKHSNHWKQALTVDALHFAYSLASSFLSDYGKTIVAKANLQWFDFAFNCETISYQLWRIAPHKL